MNNKEKCITMLNAFDEHQLESIATILQTMRKAMLNSNIDTHKNKIPIFEPAFSRETEKEKKINIEIEAYRQELEAEKTFQMSLHSESSKKEA